MRVALPKKITNDGSIPDEQQSLVDTLANILNPFMTDVATILNGNVGPDNQEAKIVKIDVKTTTTGEILGRVDVNTGLNRLPYGSLVIDVRNTENVGAIPDIAGAPYIIYTPNSQSSIRIHKILNLKPNNKYTLTIYFF